MNATFKVEEIHLIQLFELDHSFENWTSHRYLLLLRRRIPELLEVILCDVRGDMHLQQDGCPSHNAGIVREYLNSIFGDHRIGIYGPYPWPARSSDLSFIHYFLWKYLHHEIKN